MKFGSSLPLNHSHNILSTKLSDIKFFNQSKFSPAIFSKTFASPATVVQRDAETLTNVLAAAFKREMDESHRKLILLLAPKQVAHTKFSAGSQELQ